jgi:single-strand DNA-binding protein
MYQKLIIVGNLGKDPEMKYLPDGNPVTSFTVATSRKMKGEKETAWFHVSVWGKQAESCNQYLGKGSKVLVEGALKADAQGNPRTYEKKDGGGWAASFEVTADTVRFLSGKDEPADDVPF